MYNRVHTLAYFSFSLLFWYSLIQRFSFFYSFIVQWFLLSKKFWNILFTLPVLCTFLAGVPQYLYVRCQMSDIFYVKSNGKSFSPSGWRRVQCRYQKQRSGLTWRAITTSPTGCRLSQKWSLVSKYRTGTVGRYRLERLERGGPCRNMFFSWSKFV